MRISELSAVTGVPVPTIKYYLREGLLLEGVRTLADPGGVRRRSPRRLRVIRALIDSGVSVAETRKVIRSLDDPPAEPARPAGRGARRGDTRVRGGIDISAAEQLVARLGLAAGNVRSMSSPASPARCRESSAPISGCPTRSCRSTSLRSGGWPTPRSTAFRPNPPKPRCATSFSARCSSSRSCSRFGGSRSRSHPPSGSAPRRCRSPDQRCRRGWQSGRSGPSGERIRSRNIPSGGLIASVIREPTRKGRDMTRLHTTAPRYGTRLFVAMAAAFVICVADARAAGRRRTGALCVHAGRGRPALALTPLAAPRRGRAPAQHDPVRAARRDDRSAAGPSGVAARDPRRLRAVGRRRVRPGLDSRDGCPTSRTCCGTRSAERSAWSLITVPAARRRRAASARASAGQRHPHLKPARRAARDHLERAVVRVHDRRDDREPESRAIVAVRRCARVPIRGRTARSAWPRRPDPAPRRRSRPPAPPQRGVAQRRRSHPPAVDVVHDRVADEVRRELLEQRAVADDQRRPERRVETDAAGRGIRPHVVDGARPTSAAEIHRRSLSSAPPRPTRASVEQRFGRRDRTVVGRADPLEERRRRRGRPDRPARPRPSCG